MEECIEVQQLVIGNLVLVLFPLAEKIPYERRFTRKTPFLRRRVSSYFIVYLLPRFSGCCIRFPKNIQLPFVFLFPIASAGTEINCS